MANKKLGTIQNGWISRFVTELQKKVVDNIAGIIVTAVLVFLTSFTTFLITTATAINPMDQRISTVEAHVEHEADLVGTMEVMGDSILSIERELIDLNRVIEEDEDDDFRLEEKLDDFLLVWGSNN